MSGNDHVWIREKTAQDHTYLHAYIHTYIHTYLMSGNDHIGIREESAQDHVIYDLVAAIL